jgi:5-bromo-4-chloroindolyl phosphate hydrolysis protein
MKIFLVLTFLFANIHCVDTTTVYICNSKSGKKYHLKADCHGLSNCSHTVIKITLDEAKKKGKTLCGWEK